MSWAFTDVARLLEIVAVNLLLSGDNAIVVAMAIRNLPPAHRKLASAIGISAAILAETVATLTVAWALELAAVSLAGGILLALIAIRFLREGADHADPAIQHHSSQRLYHSIGIVTGAYFVMCLDNILAVAAIGRGHPVLMGLGLLLSGALLVPASLAIAQLMKRYPLTLTVGAGILGWTAGSMIALAPSRMDKLLHGSINQLVIPAVMAVVVTTSPWWWRTPGRNAARTEAAVKEAPERRRQ
jgi:YjbE family integral membrane protein